MSLADIYDQERKIDPKDFLPLREPTFFILLSLSRQARHGYAILQDIEQLSRGKLILSNGTLYGALTRLLDQELIRRVPSQEPAVSGKPRKAYKLTEFGRRVLNAEITRMQSLVRTAVQHLPEGVE